MQNNPQDFARSYIVANWPEHMLKPYINAGKAFEAFQNIAAVALLWHDFAQ